MKNALIALFVATTIALGAACAIQWQKLAAQKTQVAALRAEADQRSQEIAELQAAHKLNEKQRQELFQQAGDLARKLQASETKSQAGPHFALGVKTEAASSNNVAGAAEANKSGKENNWSNFLAKMMEDPEAKKMIREQQRLMLDQLYAPLIKQLGLTPEEAGQFKDLLADNMLKSTEKATSLMGALSSTNRTEAFEKISADQKDFDEQVRGFLGETGYAQYKDYQQTVGERTQLSQFQQQTAGGEHPLNDQQTEKLLTFMKEEKQAVATATGLPLPGDNRDAASMQAMFSGEGVEKLLQSQESVNQRVYDRAREVLSAEQLGDFGKFQTNQLQMMRMGMSMARKFMAPEKTEPAPPPGP